MKLNPTDFDQLLKNITSGDDSDSQTPRLLSKYKNIRLNCWFWGNAFHKTDLEYECYRTNDNEYYELSEEQENQLFCLLEQEKYQQLEQESQAEQDYYHMQETYNSLWKTFL